MFSKLRNNAFVDLDNSVFFAASHVVTVPIWSFNFAPPFPSVQPFNFAVADSLRLTCDMCYANCFLFRFQVVANNLFIKKKSHVKQWCGDPL